MGTQSTTNKPKVCPSVSIPDGDFGRIFYQLMSAQRLTLALHRLGAEADPKTLIAWETFTLLNDACNRLGEIAGYGPDETEVD